MNNNLNKKIGSTTEIIKESQNIRYKVFSVEQEIPPELDVDGLDGTSIHIVVDNGDLPIATARLTIKEDATAVIARVAVIKSHRGYGIANSVVKDLIQRAQQEGVKSIKINAHEHLRNFYSRLGFESCEHVEVVGNHQLIEMIYNVSQ